MPYSQNARDASSVVDAVEQPSSLGLNELVARPRAVIGRSLLRGKVAAVEQLPQHVVGDGAVLRSALQGNRSE